MWAGRCRRGMIAALVLAIAAGWSYAQDSGTSGPATTLEAHGLRIVFFHSLTCNECRKVKRMLDRILKPWGGRVRVEWKSTGDIQVFRELLLYDEHYGVRTKSPPVMFVGRRHLEGEKRIYRDLARVVREEFAAGAVTYRPPAGAATRGGGDVPEEIVGRFRGFRIAALAAWSLMDFVRYRRMRDTKKVTLGPGRAAVLEGIRRYGAPGATVACVGSTKPFYRSLGFRPAYRSPAWQREWA
jgi:hypothetical protein